MVKKVKRLAVPKPSQDVRFDRSLIMILLAVLILLISFLVYSNSSLKTPTETTEEGFFGSECTIDLDCPQPKCPGIENVCDNGYCVIQQTGPSATKCIDLNVPVCGNDICEADEKDICPTDCGSDEVEICNNDGNCEINLVEKGYSENEDYKNCADCWCGDLVCDDKEKLDSSCPEDCIH